MPVILAVSRAPIVRMRLKRIIRRRCRCGLEARMLTLDRQCTTFKLLAKKKVWGVPTRVCYARFVTHEHPKLFFSASIGGSVKVLSCFFPSFFHLVFLTREIFSHNVRNGNGFSYLSDTSSILSIFFSRYLLPHSGTWLAVGMFLLDSVFVFPFFLASSFTGIPCLYLLVIGKKKIVYDLSDWETNSRGK